MEYTKVTGTGVEISRVAIGTWAIGGWMWGGTDDDQAIAAIHRALDLGITLIDTAPVYGFGHSETVVGRALTGGWRERAVIATKAGLEWSNDGVRRNSSRARLLKEIDDSLHRLQTDHVDIYQIHWPDPRTPFAETGAVLRELYDAGKIRAIGVSNFSPAQMDELAKTAPLHTDQPPYNLFEREIERDVLPYTRAHGIAALTYGALCRGLLSGTMSKTRAFAGDDLRNTDPKFREPRYSEYLGAVDRLDRFAHERYGKRVIHLAVRWLLDRPGVSAALWGVRRADQLDPLPEVFDFSLDASALAEIDRIVHDEVRDPVGPEFMAPPA
ncbi:MAG TPA: aldo/keto reductase [Candidatus Acidoferrales bacterium]|nr:aldo/keto reductase [Candidatus Acidoferrales bacterium]